VPLVPFVAIPLCGSKRIPSNRQRTRAVTEFVERDAGLAEEREQQVRHWGFVWEFQVAAGLEFAAKFSGEQAGQIEMAMQISIAHSAAV